MNKDILSFWPFPEYPPRENQIKALTWLAENSDKKYLILESPVGSGKSWIAATYARYLKRAGETKASFILTPQKILQRQYENDFDGMDTVPLYGKANYQRSGNNLSCDICSVVNSDCPGCPHKTARTLATRTDHVIFNYKLALTSFAFTDTFPTRSLIIADECHTLERQLVDFDALQVTYGTCKKYNLQFKVHQKLDDAVLWMKDYYLPNINPVHLNMEAEATALKERPSSSLSRTEINKIREFNNLSEHIDEATIMVSRTTEYIEDNFVLVWDKSMFQFKRLTGGYSFHNILNPRGNKFLFMSSTVLDKDGFCNDLQIPKEETAFLSLDSEFPVENRPIYYMPRMKMNYQWDKPENTNKRKDMINVVKTLLESHKEENGIIHTANFKVADWLTEELSSGPHDVYEHGPTHGNNRDDTINGFLSATRKRILISPSSTEGLDLKNELASFAIFVKTPYPYLGDQWIKRRMDISSEWYKRQTLINIIQGGGRIVRTEDDTGVVYIVDASFGYLFQSAHYMIPQWWKDAYAVV